MVDVSAVDQLQDIVIVQVLMKLLHHCLELIEVHHSVLITVKLSEDRPEPILGLGLTDTGADDVEELRELDGFVLVPEGVDEGEDEGVALVEAQIIDDLVDFSRVNAAAAVLIEDFEGLLKLIIILSQETVLPRNLGRLLGRLCGGLCFGCSAHSNSNQCGLYEASKLDLNYLALFGSVQMQGAKREKGELGNGQVNDASLEKCYQ